MTLNPPAATSPPPASETRASPRTAMFVSAVMLAEGGSSEVRLRNMSKRGALVEAAMLPPMDTPVDLVRGNLRISGQVVWSRPGQCGVRFAGPADVVSWMARQPPVHQQRVDAMVAEARRSMGQAATAAPSEPASRLGPDGGELRAIIALIEGLEAALSDDPDMIMRHGEALQGIDRALQRLRLLAARHP